MCCCCGTQSKLSNNCMEKHGNVMMSNNGEAVQPCKICSEKQDKESVKQEDSNPQIVPSISPTASLKSSASSLSSCSEFSVDTNSYGRGDIEDCSTDSSQEDSGYTLKADLPNFTIPVQANGVHPSNTLVVNDLVVNNSVNNNLVCKDIKNTGVPDGREAGGSSGWTGSSPVIEEIESVSSDETDEEFWLPPVSEGKEDDVMGSVATYDDEDEDEDEDDEYNDDANWRKTNSLASFEEEGSTTYKFKEEKRRALDEVMNGKFRALVGQLLRSVGVATSGEAGARWVDILTSLSWQAASYVRPDHSEGKEMDPDGYVKIKCVATGSCIQSQVIKGLVFKKHAAHKRMPTKYKNPKFLLIQGALGLSSSGLSSLGSMEQEKDSQKSIIDMIEMYNPNVILVEKTVSRDIQESILAKGMTLVLDMKLDRLKKVARCTGSPIISPDSSTGQQLKHCDSFHFEKFVEEHAPVDEGGKRPSKTLMFIEGCPTRLGCTILLLGANSDELKRIKYAVRCAVVMAYHFMLETSFLLDQRAMFSTIGLNEVASVALSIKEFKNVGAAESNISSGEESNDATFSSRAIDIPISNGFHDKGPHKLSPEAEGDSSLSFEPFKPISLSGRSSFSASLKNVTADSFPLFPSSGQTLSGRIVDETFPTDEIDRVQTAIQISGSSKSVNHIDEEPKFISSREKELNFEQPHPTSSSNPLDTQSSSNKHDINAVLDSESILVLMSSRNASRGTMCEHSHFSHIKFYKSFDVPLGKFLQDNLLNQKLRCKACGEPPEAHYFYYAHHNKQLTIQVRRLPVNNHLDGETEGKLWMWSRCGKCKFRSGSSKSSKLVLLSSAARRLSFGKFLELSFSNNTLFDQPSCCGHTFHRDFLYFFGLGPLVAMFKYSTVPTYSVYLPPEKLEFSRSIGGDFLKKDFDEVYTNGIAMFLDIENSLKEIRARLVGVNLNIRGSIKGFSDIEEMLKHEKCQFEVDIQNAVQNGSRDEAVYKLLSLNRVRLELLIVSCVWDLRISSLSSSDSWVTDTKDIDLREMQTNLKENENGVEEVAESEVTVESSENFEDHSSHVKIKLVTPVEANEVLSKEIPIDEDIFPGEGSLLCDQEKAIPLTTYIGASGLDLNKFQMCKSRVSLSSKLENEKGWIWTPYAQILRDCMEDLHRGNLPKFGSVNSYPLETTAHRLVTDEGSRLHIPLGIDDYILSDYENELSSIIACALALLNYLPHANEDHGEDGRNLKAYDCKTHENSHILPRFFSLNSQHWSSIGSSDSDGHYVSNTYSEDSRHSSFDGLDSLVLSDATHSEISMGIGKLSGKRKYSVICLYASQFHQLRNRWCPSEVDYIASLSRCKNWDAKGGKSKSFFAKTLDDRFIIKEIKRTEFDSFVKFAPNYFEYMNQCHELRNQTCLAKILGIYQVIVRQTKSGKETRHDLMVMENLSFGRSFARSYDLKGALHARLSTAASDSGDVLLDQNFVNDMNSSPLYVSRKSKRNLQRGVWNDTTFLNSINVMDYSLLVGVDIQRRELVCGIIDYLRQYTWDKQLETWVKSSLVPKNQLPTVISPKEYKKRFRKFIDTHFLSVPDHWCSQRSSNPCELCGLGDDENALNSRSQELQYDDDDDSAQAKSPEEGKYEDYPSHDKSAEGGDNNGTYVG